MTLVELAMKLRPYIEKAAGSLDDADGSDAVELFPKMKLDSSLIPAGTRINWNGVLKRAAVDLWDTETNTPDAAPTLWEDISYKEGYRIIPETITSTLAFANGERGWWDDILYESLRDGNCYTPAVTPEWWKIVE